MTGARVLRRGGAVAACALLGLSVACGAGGPAGPSAAAAPPSTVAPSPVATLTPVPTASPTPAGLETTDRFSVVLPPKWKRIELDPAVGQRAIAQIDDPMLRGPIGAQAQALFASGGLFLAYDFTPERATPGFLTNVTIIRKETAIAYDLDFIAQVNIGQIEGLDSVQKPIRHGRVTLPAGASERLQYTVATKLQSGSGLTYVVTQYLLVNAKEYYVLTFSCAPSQAAAYETVFDGIAGSFALKR